MKSKFINTLLFVLTSIICYGQSSGNVIINNNISDFPFAMTTFGTKYGLPQNQVFSIVEKDDQSIFVSTANGVVSFNGYVFEKLSSHSDNKKFIYTNLHWDTENQILYGNTSNGQYHQIYPNFEVKKGGFYGSQHFRDTLFTIDASGLIQASNLSRKNVFFQMHTNLKGVRLIVRLGNSFLLSNENGLFLFEKNNREIKRLSSEMFEAYSLCPKEDRVALACKNHILVLSESKNIVKKIFFGDSERTETFPSTPKGLLHLKDSTFLITTSDEIIYVNNGNINKLSDASSFTGGTYITIYKHSSQNSIFIGSSIRGLVLFNPLSGRVLKRKNTIEEQSFGSMIKLPSGSIITYSSRGRLLKIRNNRVELIRTARIPFSTLSYIDGFIYAGYWGNYGIQKMDTSGNVLKTYPQFDDRDNYRNYHISSIHKDQKGMFWVGTFRGLLYGETLDALKPVKNISGRVSSIFESSSGHIFVGGEKGYFKLLNKKYEPRIISNDQSINYEVRTFYEDDEGKIWIGTYGAGLFCLKENKLFSFNNNKDVLLSEDVFTLALDKHHRFLCSSNDGLFIVEKEDLENYMNGDTEHIVPIVFNSNSGIPTSEFNGGFLNSYAESNGIFYFPTIDGVYVIEPPLLKNYNRNVNISSVLVNDSLSPVNDLLLERNQNNIEIAFFTPTFNPTRNVHYQYRLNINGVQSEWSSLTKDLVARFLLLPNGTFNFQVRSIDGISSSDIAVTDFNFEIQKSFFESWVFYILILFIIIILISIYLYIRTAAIREKQEQESNLNNYFLDLKMKAVQSKMNPHFLFNTLNNINYLLATEQYEEAEDHLQEFSILVREFLQNSEKSFIKIANEIKMIKLYLSIEKRRFPKLLNFEINVDDELKELVIPTLMIQPFAENAIKHGIAHSDNPCMLSISIQKTEDQGIEIIIEDDGIGRKRSMEINKSRVGHNSMGIEIVKDKIKVVRNKYNIFIDLQTIDKEEPNTGTIVKIKIPKHDKVFDS